MENNIELEKQKNIDNFAIADTISDNLDENDSKHKSVRQQITVNKGRIENLISQTEDNFTKLCLAQSRNSHDTIASMIYDYSGKSKEMTRTIEQDLDFTKAQQLEYALSLTEIEKGVAYTKSKLAHFSEQSAKTLQEIKQTYDKMEEAQNSIDYVYNRDNRYNREHAGRLDKESEEEEENMTKLLKETTDLLKIQKKVCN